MNTGETRSCRNDPTPSAFAMRPELLRDARLRRVRRTTPFGVFGKLGELYFPFPHHTSRIAPGCMALRG